MEILRWLKFRKIKEANGQNPQIPSMFSKQIREGQKLSERDALAQLLGLTDNDLKLLHILCGQKLLYLEADQSMQIFRFRQSRNGGREYKVHKESDKSMKLKQLADSMSVFIDTFIQENYQESGVNKAWTLRNAVNSLFAQTSYVDQKTGLTDKIWHFETFEAWAKEWRPRLDSSNSQPH